jgi:hypothetical protein
MALQDLRWLAVLLYFGPSWAEDGGMVCTCYEGRFWISLGNGMSSCVMHGVIIAGYGDCMTILYE